MSTSKLVWLSLLMLLSFSTYADDNTNVLSQRVQKAHDRGMRFQSTTLFHNVNTVNTFSFLKASKTLAPIAHNIEALYGTRPQAVSIDFTVAGGKTYTLEMLQATPLSSSPNFGVINGSSRTPVSFDKGLHYQGAVKGMEKSIASMSVFADGTVMILFANDDGNFNLGALQDNSGRYILYNDRDMLDQLAYPCGAEQLKDQPHTNDGTSANKTTAVTICRKVQIYWECDYELYQDKGSLTATQNYLIGLFNQKQTMYNNENIAVELSSLYIWTSQDFFEDNNSGNSLDHFQEYWNTMDMSYDGDYAQLIAKDPGGRGGVSYRDILCNRNFAYGYADINGSYNTVPTYSWDVMVITHETGHALGSRHTHWCGWNTGAGNTCGSIDDCVTQEFGNGCNTCSSTFLKSNTSWKGTVMSYCHLVSGKGIDLSNGFGPLPGADIRTKVTAASCLRSMIDADLVVTEICNNDGSIMLNFNSGNFSDTPYTYKWSHGPTTKDLTALSTAGTYTITVTEKNSCSNTFSATINKNATPGDGEPVVFQLPLCCKDTSFVFTLTADLPTDLSTCQTVAWLRTPTAITTYADAKANFDTIGASNIITPTNVASISNATAATLDVATPNPCDSLRAYYYTPFVSRVQKAAKTITSAQLSIGGITAGSNTFIGSYFIINDQSGLVNNCDLLDTPTTKELVVTLTNYSGRANYLTIVVIDADGRVIHKKTDYAGNGTYTIPLENNENLLKTMTIQAFDFNCATSSNCNFSTVSINAVRTVTYDSIAQNTFDNTCTVGNSVLLSFAPNNCFNLNIPLTNANILGDIKIYPNPTSQVATLDFDVNKDGIGTVYIVDALGKTVSKRTINYYMGNNKVLLDAGGLAKGVYFVSLKTGAGTSNSMKLIVE